jgi:DUF177 domain-containing protein
VDLRSPLVLSTHELGRRAGSMRTVQMTVPAPADVGTALVGVDAGSDLVLDLRLEAVMEGVLVSGEVRGVVVGECGRCLGPIRQPVSVPVQELFVYPDRVASEDEEEEELPEVEGDLIDLEPTLRDAVVTALPFQPLCRPDCPGLCPECGARLADVPAPHVHEKVDARWAALRGLAAGSAGAGAGGADVESDVDGAGGTAGRT